jgi:hypothetical protein
MADAHVPGQLCVMCKEDGTKICGNCHEMHYCSSICQKNDWPMHKLLCKTFKNFSAAERPSPYHKRAILLSEDGDAPHFAWIPIFRPDDKSHLLPLFSALPGISKDIKCCLDIKDNPVLGRSLPKEVTLWGIITDTLDTEANITTEKKNRSIRKVDEELSDLINGPLVLLGMNIDPVHGYESYDLGPLQFRFVMDGLRMIHSVLEDRRAEKPTGPTVKGQRWNCYGDVYIVGRGPNCETIDVPTSLASAQFEVQAWVTERVGLPLMAQKIPSSLMWRDRKTSDGQTCVYKTFAKIMNPYEPDGNLDHYPGSLLLTRKDGKPFLQAHIHALLDWADAKRNLQTFARDTFIDEFKASYNKEDFAEYYKLWMKGGSRDPNFVGKGVPSPYEM